MRLTSIKTSIISVIGFLLIVAFTTVGCNHKNDSPSATVERFFTVLEKEDIKAYGEVMDQNTAMIMASGGKTIKDMLMAASGGGIAKINSEKIENDTATVEVTLKNGKTDIINLVKEDGRWKVKTNQSL